MQNRPIIKDGHRPDVPVEQVICFCFWLSAHDLGNFLSKRNHETRLAQFAFLLEPWQ